MNRYLAAFEGYDRDANFASVTLGVYFGEHDEHRAAVVEDVKVETSVLEEVTVPILFQTESRAVDCESTVRVLAAVNFETDSADLNAIARSRLDGVVAKRGDEITGILGHTDTRGNAEYNLALSQKRIDVVISYLAKQGIDTASLRTTSFGETRPSAGSTVNGGHAGSRRVDLYGKNCI